MAANPCGKRVTPKNAYEVWQSDDGAVITYVLKKYQAPEKEKQNPFARWYCAVSSPGTMHRLEFGDVYVAHVTRDAHKLETNPLTQPSTGGQA